MEKAMASHIKLAKLVEFFLFLSISDNKFFCCNFFGWILFRMNKSRTYFGRLIGWFGSEPRHYKFKCLRALTVCFRCENKLFCFLAVLWLFLMRRLLRLIYVINFAEESFSSAKNCTFSLKTELQVLLKYWVTTCSCISWVVTSQLMSFIHNLYVLSMQYLLTSIIWNSFPCNFESIEKRETTLCLMNDP